MLAVVRLGSRALHLGGAPLKLGLRLLPFHGEIARLGEVRRLRLPLLGVLRGRHLLEAAALLALVRRRAAHRRVVRELDVADADPKLAHVVEHAAEAAAHRHRRRRGARRDPLVRRRLQDLAEGLEVEELLAAGQRVLDEPLRARRRAQPARAHRLHERLPRARGAPVGAQQREGGAREVAELLLEFCVLGFWRRFERGELLRRHRRLAVLQDVLHERARALDQRAPDEAAVGARRDAAGGEAVDG